MTPAISIVVPTHNRRASVLRLLQAIEREDASSCEVTVVADGCTDDTAIAIRHRHWRMPVHLIEQASTGPAQARNRGAALAAAPIVLFLDDDMEPEPGTVEAHREFHRHCRDAIGIGDLNPKVSATGLFGVILRGWWHGMYDGMRQPGHRYTYRDLMSGHVSMPRALFDRLGGFDPAFRCHEDWELGYRAIRKDVALRLVKGAVAVHHEATDLEKALQRKMDEGIADCQLLTRYPELASLLPLSRDRRRLTARSWSGHDGHYRLARLRARMLLSVYERLALRFRWRNLLEYLLDAAYWRGVAAAGGTADDLRKLLLHGRSCKQPAELTIDLASGLEAARRALDARRPRSVRLLFAGRLVGDVPAAPGAERLEGRHLPRLIARQFAIQYLDAAADSGALPKRLRRLTAIA